MTLQDILKILDLNPLWKEASESTKVTVINQFLNDLVISDKLEDSDSIKKYTYQVERYDTVTFKDLQKVLEIDYTEEEVFLLFQYTLLDYSLSNPYHTSLVTSPYFGKSIFPWSFEQKVTYDNSAKHNKKNAIYSINQKVNHKFQPVAIKSGTHTFDQKVSYDIMDSYTSSIFSLDYSVTYNIWE